MATLRDLGLSEYEARVYRSLLHTGPTTAKALSQASDVPMGRIYDVLNSLESRRLLRTQTAGRPKKYVAVEPSTALDRLLEAKQRELAEREAQYATVVTELEAELEATTPNHEQFWTAAVGPNETAELLLERLAGAHRQIVMVADDPSPTLDIQRLGDDVLAQLEAALDRGVTVEVLLSRSLVDSLSPTVGRRYRRRLQSREGFSVRTNDAVAGTFNVIDNVEVCINVPNPLDAGAMFGMIDLKDPDFARQVQAAFRPSWEVATPLSL